MTKELYGRALHHYETDGDGVCHFSNYLRIFEEAFEHRIAGLGFPLAGLTHSFAVLELKVSYLIPIRFGERFEVSVDFQSVKRTFTEVVATISKGQEECALLSAKFVAVARTNNASVAITKDLREKLIAQ